MSDEARPKAYSYVRFSTPEQALGDSFRRQTDAASEYAAKHGLDLVTSFADLGVSAFEGKNILGGKLGIFLRLVEDGDIPEGSYLLVENLDRVSRDALMPALATFQKIIMSGITIVTLQDGKELSEALINANPFLIFESLISMIRANEESEVKSKRLRNAWSLKKREATSNLTPMTAHVPAWLRLADDRKNVEIIEERATVIRRIFSYALEGIGQDTIAQRLNVEGLETFGEGKRRAKYWHRSYISKILRSQAVIGTFIPHEIRRTDGKKTREPLAPIPGYFPAVVDQKTFKAIQTRFAGGNTPRMRAAKGEVSNILAGLAKCPLCASSMTRVNKGRKGATPYLVCAKAKAGAGCDYKAAKLVMVEDGIIHAGTRRLVEHVPLGNPEIDHQLRMANDYAGDQRSIIARLVDQIADGTASPAISQRLRKAERELSETEGTISTLEAQDKRTNKRTLARIVANLENTLGNPKATITQRNTALRDAFTHVVVDHQSGDLRFHWKQGGDPTVVPYTVVDV